MQNIEKKDTNNDATSIHEPVLLQEVVETLLSPLGGGHFLDCEARRGNWRSQKGESTDEDSYPWYLDGTLGGGGLMKEIAKALKGKINIIGLDQDEKAIERAERSFKGIQIGGAKLILECENFRNLDEVLVRNGLHETEKIDMMLLDLGFSSDELEGSGRGFSFQKDEPLLMTMGEAGRHPFTARDILNNWTEEDIANVIYGYGEERFARRIARNVVSYRSKKQIGTTFELVEIVKMSVPTFYKRGKLNPATKTFQALRIATNDELKALKEGLKKGFDALRNGGKMAVISFHSLEDRIVKEFYKEKGTIGAKIITKKPITASPQEIAENPRSRSAKLRIIQK